MNAGNVIILDLDGTLTVDDKMLDYCDRLVNPRVAQAASNAKAAGYRVVVATSRSMRTYRGDVELIRRHSLPVIHDWLHRHGIGHDEVVVGKPWCGPRGFYVDDRNMHLDEFVFRFGGPWFRQRVALICTAADLDPEALGPLHHGNRHLERLLDVAAYLYTTGNPEVSSRNPEIRDDPRCQVALDTDKGAVERFLAMAGADIVMVTRPSEGSRDPASHLGMHLERLGRLDRPVPLLGQRLDLAIGQGERGEADYRVVSVRNSFLLAPSALVEPHIRQGTHAGSIEGMFEAARRAVALALPDFGIMNDLLQHRLNP